MADHSSNQHDHNPHSDQSDAAHGHDSHGNEKGSLVNNIPALIGLLIVLIVVIWGLANLVSLTSSWFSSNFYKPNNALQVTAPSSAISGVPFAVSWKYSANTNGSYALLYGCVNGLSMTMPGATSTPIAIPCGIAYTVAGSGTSLSLTPKLSGWSDATSTLTIIFIPGGTGARAQGSAAILIHPPIATTPAVEKPKPAMTGTKKPTTYIATHTSGPADIDVRIISSGVDANGTGFVTFDIGNIGGSTSGAYTFSAQLPTTTFYPYNSAVQAPLAPGSHVVNTLSFTSVAPGGGMFSVIVVGGDTNSINNTASVMLVAPYQQTQTYNYAPSYTPAPVTVYPNSTY